MNTQSIFKALGLVAILLLVVTTPYLGAAAPGIHDLSGNSASGVSKRSRVNPVKPPVLPPAALTQVRKK